MRILTPEFWKRFWQHATEVVAHRGLLLIGILIAYFMARAVVNRLIDGAVARNIAKEERPGGLPDRANRLRTLQNLGKNISGLLLSFVLVVMLLDALGANVMGIITTAGVGGVAIGLGAQKVVRYVTIGTVVGVVEDLGVRITRIRDDQGKLWTLSNGDIVTVANHSRAPVEANIEIGIAQGQDIKRVESIIDEVGKALHTADPGELAEAPNSAGVVNWDAARTVIRVHIVCGPRHLAAEQIRVREAIYDKLRESEIPVA